MQNLLRNSAILLIVAGVAFGLGRYMAPEKVVTVEKKAEQVDTSTTTRETVTKDGTIIKEVIKNNIVKVEIEKMKLVENKKPQWKATVLSDSKFEKYGFQVERRVFANVFAGIGMNTNKQATLSLGMEF